MLSWFENVKKWEPTISFFFVIEERAYIHILTLQNPICFICSISTCEPNWCRRVWENVIDLRSSLHTWIQCVYSTDNRNFLLLNRVNILIEKNCSSFFEHCTKMDRTKPPRNERPTVKLGDINFTPVFIALLVVLISIGKWIVFQISQVFPLLLSLCHVFIKKATHFNCLAFLFLW